MNHPYNQNRTEYCEVCESYTHTTTQCPYTDDLPGQEADSYGITIMRTHFDGTLVETTINPTRITKRT